MNDFEKPFNAHQNLQIYMWIKLQDDFPLASLPLLGYSVGNPSTEDEINKVMYSVCNQVQKINMVKNIVGNPSTEEEINKAKYSVGNLIPDNEINKVK